MSTTEGRKFVDHFISALDAANNALEKGTSMCEKGVSAMELMSLSAEILTMTAEIGSAELPKCKKLPSGLDKEFSDILVKGSTLMIKANKFNQKAMSGCSN